VRDRRLHGSHQDVGIFLSFTVTLLTMMVAGRTWTSLLRMAKTRE
jgi:hypothetical protein